MIPASAVKSRFGRIREVEDYDSASYKLAQAASPSV